MIWPDNMAAVETFIALGTQWRVGVAGATGLDYAALPGVLRMTGISRKDWADVFTSIRVMEEVALACMHKK